MVVLRISRIKDTPCGLIIKVEGRIVSDWITLLEQECHQNMDADRELILDLGNVSYVDENGRLLLRRLLNSAWKLSQCSSFIHQLLQQPERDL